MGRRFEAIALAGMGLAAGCHLVAGLGGVDETIGGLGGSASQGGMAGYGGAAGGGGAGGQTGVGGEAGAGGFGGMGGVPNWPTWSSHFGDAQDQQAIALAAATNGDTVIVGSMMGVASFGGATFMSAGKLDAFVARFDSAGQHLWSQRFGDGGDQVAAAVAIDSSGAVIVAGNFEGTIDLGGGPMTTGGADDIFLAKFDPNGAPIWSARYGDSNIRQLPTGVAVDGNDNIILAGLFRGSIDFGGGALNGAGGDDVFIAKLDSNGNFLWARQFGGVAQDGVSAVAVDSVGNVYITGFFAGSISFDGTTTLSTAGGYDAYLAKFDASGSHQWSKRFGSSSGEIAYGIAVSPIDVSITGVTELSVDFGAGLLSGGGARDVFVASFDHNGAHRWSRLFGDSADHQIGNGISSDPLGNTVVVGQFEGSINFGGDTLSSAGSRDAFVAALDAQGNHLWSGRYGDAVAQQADAVAIDLAGRTLVAGCFEGSIDFGSGLMVAAGGRDAYVASLPP